jgi:polar amino acid transport system substrate-binding protein
MGLPGVSAALFCFLLIVASLSFHPLLATTARDLVPAHIKSRGTITWGSDADGGAPFVYADPADPKRTIGFEVEIAEALGKQLGLKFERRQVSWESIVPSLQRGDFDVAMNGLEPTPSRRRVVFFTRPYYIFQQQLTIRKDASGPTSLAECSGKKVGALGNSVGMDYLNRTPGIVAVAYEDQVKTYVDLELGRLEAVISDLPAARFYAGHNPALRDAAPPFGEDFYAIAVRPADKELMAALDMALSEMILSGELKQILVRWKLWSPVQEKLSEPNLLAADDGKKSEFSYPEALKLLARAASVTVLISVIAMAGAVLVGFLLALGRLFGNKVTSRLCLVYVEVVRGTPVLVQLLFLYYGLAQFGVKLPALVAGIIGLALNYAAYEAEIYRSTIEGIPKGQWEASAALGLTFTASLRHVILPQAFRAAIGPSTNDFVALFKDSSIVSVITVVELTKQYQILANSSFRFLELGLVTAGFYFALSYPLAHWARRFEEGLRTRDRG